MNAESYAIEQWDDMVFQNRNKDYGAYIIRQLYKKHVFRGVAITVSLLTLLILIPFIVSLFKPKELPSIMEVENIVYIDLTPPPPIEINPAKLTAAPSVKPVDKRMPPEVVKEVIPDEPPPMEDVKKEEPKEETPVTEEGSLTGVETGKGSDREVYTIIEKLPQFVGGEKMLTQFLQNNIRRPISLQRNHLKGTVFVSFIVNIDGSLENIQIMRGFFADCDKEAERVVKSMPNWEPGIMDGKPVRANFLLKITF